MQKGMELWALSQALWPPKRSEASLVYNILCRLCLYTEQPPLTDSPRRQLASHILAYMDAMSPRTRCLVTSWTLCLLATELHPLKVAGSQAIFPTDAIMSHIRAQAIPLPQCNWPSCSWSNQQGFCWRWRAPMWFWEWHHKMLASSWGLLQVQNWCHHGQWKLRGASAIHDWDTASTLFEGHVHSTTSSQSHKLIPEHAVVGWNVSATSFTSNTLIDLNLRIESV